MSKFKTPIKYGVAGFLVMCMFSFIAYLFYHQMFSSRLIVMVYGFSVVALAVFIPVWGGVTFRREGGGYISFANAFVGVFIICAMSALGIAIMSYLIPNVIDTKYPEELLAFVKETVSSQMAQEGRPQTEISARLNEISIDTYKPSILMVLQSFGKNLLVSAVASLIISLFIKRNSQFANTEGEQAMPSQN